MSDLTLPELEAKLKRNPIKGFLASDEAHALYALALESSAMGPVLEIGSYCGLSTVYLGAAARQNASLVFAVDHHRGSEEHQLGEAYHDADLFDSDLACMDSLPELRRTLRAFDLESTVVPVVTQSRLAAKYWQTPLAMVFIDGGHSEAMSKEDCLLWGKQVMPGGVLAIHDIFEHPEDGGQGPYRAMLAVQAEVGFTLEKKVNSLGVLRKPRLNT